MRNGIYLRRNAAEGRSGGALNGFHLSETAWRQYVFINGKAQMMNNPLNALLSSVKRICICELFYDRWSVPLSQQHSPVTVTLRVTVL